MHTLSRDSSLWTEQESLMTYRMQFVYAVCVHPPRLWGVLHAQVSLFGSGLTPERNTEQTWLGEARNREVPPQALGHRRKRKGARSWHQHPGRGGVRQCEDPEREHASPRPPLPPSLRSSAALRLRPSPTRHPGRAHPGGSRGPLVLFAPPGRRRGADGQVAESGGGQSPLPSVGGGDGAQGFPAGRSCSPAAAADPDSVRTPRRK